MLSSITFTQLTFFIFSTSYNFTNNLLNSITLTYDFFSKHSTNILLVLKSIFLINLINSSSLQVTRICFFKRDITFFHPLLFTSFLFLLYHIVTYLSTKMFHVKHIFVIYLSTLFDI